MNNPVSNLPEPCLRKCLIRFDRELSADVLQLLNNSLFQHDNIEDVQSEYSELLIQYRFPGMTSGMILSDVFKIVDKSGCRVINRLINNILAFMEGNEKNFIIYTCGWSRYIEDIYANSFDPGLIDGKDIRAQTWRKYK